MLLGFAIVNLKALLQLSFGDGLHPQTLQLTTKHLTKWLPNSMQFISRESREENSHSEILKRNSCFYTMIMVGLQMVCFMRAPITTQHALGQKTPRKAHPIHMPLEGGYVGQPTHPFHKFLPPTYVKIDKRELEPQIGGGPVLLVEGPETKHCVAHLVISRTSSAEDQ